MSGSDGNRGGNCGEKRGGREQGGEAQEIYTPGKERNCSDDEQWCKNM